MPLTYETIKTTATTFILANNPSPTNTPQKSLLNSLVSPSFTISFGHKYFTSTTPHLQHPLDFDGFMAHQMRMTPLLARWRAVVKDCFVDVEKGVAVVVSEFFMTPRRGGKGGGDGDGNEETVVNEIVWFVEVEEGGVVGRVVEWVDGVAAGRLGEIFRGEAGGM
ncbi:Vacuolar amino acid transporter 3 [Venturia nashicola]|uniref:Vacuolar amino acid transporter 3 n=1 Tax=Venturia nashicola TaxID=86259 RepID=A0A4Z1NP66_9PEZI|nr:Vacuolar amino acid transporter 3 [Venturia nashicola]